MRYPYDRYMKALLLKGYSVTTISDRLRAFKLTPPTEAEMDKLRDSLLVNLPEESLEYARPGVKYDFEKFLQLAGDSLKSLDIDEMIDVMRGNKIPHWNEALLIMTDMDARILVECMYVYGKEDKEILKAVKDRYRARVSLEGLQLFYKYFWDLEGMSQLEIYNYIGSCTHRRHRSLLVSSYRQREKETSWKLSGQNTLTLEDILTTVMNESFEKFKTSVAGEDTESMNKTLQWANMAMRAAEKLEDITGKATPAVAADLELRLAKIKQTDIPEMSKLKEDII